MLVYSVFWRNNPHFFRRFSVTPSNFFAFFVVGNKINTYFCNSNLPKLAMMHIAMCGAVGRSAT